jgi:ATP-dependent Clp protease ATP-binding subunit ClpA
LEKLSDALKQKVFGQDEAISKILSNIVPKNNTKRASLLLTGSPGVGKTELAKRLSKQMRSDGLRVGGGDVSIIVIDEPHKMTAEEFSDAFAKATGQPTRAQVGEMAARACHEGTTQAITPMKQLHIKRGFASVQYAFN